MEEEDKKGDEIKLKKEAKKDAKENGKKSKTTKIIIILLIVIALIVAFGVGGYFAKKHIDENKSVGTEWGDTYYAFLKTVQDAEINEDSNKLSEVRIKERYKNSKHRIYTGKKSRQSRNDFNIRS